MKTHFILLWLFYARGTLGQHLIQGERYAGDESLTRSLISDPTSDAEIQSPADSEDAEVVFDEDGKPRDKRTLGLIVAGLANALGYTLTPIQVASLPNPTPAPAAAPPAPPAAAPKAPAPPAPPKQRETIRLTGLLNFGANANANIPVQLEQYEKLFHGIGVPRPPAAGAPSSPTPVPTLAAIAPLAKIPSPIVPNLTPLVPPARPPTSGPKAPAPTKQAIETVYRKNENLVKYNVESKEILGDKDVPEKIYAGENAQGQDPPWQQVYVDRLKELERQQKENAERLKFHEEQLLKQQHDHENTDERFSNREKEIAQRDEEATSALREQQKEREEEGLRISEGPDAQNEQERAPKEYTEYDEEPRKYSDYADYPQKLTDYDSEDGERLPISVEKEKEGSKDVRNSYGESLEDQGKVDENIADYFERFKDSRTGLYVPEKTQNAENYKTEKEPWWKGSQEDFDGRIDRLKQEYSSPAPESKYEEYELEETPQESPQAEEPEKVEPTTPRPAKGAQKVPDYSEAFGGHEPYVQQLEPRHNQEIIPPSTDTLHDSNSELKQDSNAESESEDDKEIPLYRFDFKSFLPYYSPIKYDYGPEDDAPHSSRLESYSQHSEEQEAAQPTEIAPVERGEPNEELRPKIGLPERLTMKSLHDGEAKELHAWPAPFDHVFDSTEQTNVAELPRIHDQSGTEVPVEGTAEPYNEGLHATPAFLPDYDAEFQHNHGSNQEQKEPESYQGHAAETQSLQEVPEGFGFLDRFRLSLPLVETPRQTQDPEGQRPELPNRYTSSDGSYPQIEASAVPATEDVTSHGAHQQYQPVESQHNENTAIKKAPELQKADFRDRLDFSQHYTPSEPRLSGRRFDGTESDQLQKNGQVPSVPEEQPEDKSSLKFSDPKSAHDFFGFSQNDYDYENNQKIEKSQELKEPQSFTGGDESEDLLVVQDPMPYQYDVSLTKFTDQPESDTEKVKVKEYRNTMATVTVSERKQLSPEGPPVLFGYSYQY